MIDKIVIYDNDMVARVILGQSGKVPRDFLASTTLSENVLLTIDSKEKFINCACEIKDFFSSKYQKVEAKISFSIFIESVIFGKNILKAKEIVFESISFNEKFGSKINNKQQSQGHAI